MRKHLLVALAFLALAGFGLQTASAQLPGGIPRMPRPGKPKATPTPAPTESAPPAPARETPPAAQPQPTTSSASAPAAPAPAGGQGLPVIAKEWLQVRPETLSTYKGSYGVTSWLPRLVFTTNVDLPSGARYYAEFMQPNGAPWVKLDCSWGQSELYGCKVPDATDQQSTTAVGVFPFAIKIKNPLDGTDKTLFTGKAKVEKAPQLAPELKKPAQVSYFANYDWALPIGYVFDEGDWPAVAFTVRGTNSSGLELHAFYKGQEVGTSAGAFDCSTTEQNPQPTNGTHDSVPQGGTWERVACSLKGLQWTTEGSSYHNLSKNPGEYEVKVLWKNELVRTMKFTVGPNGRLADNGIARANGIVGLDPVNGRDTKRVVIPVTVLGTQDGKWDRNAWKTDAFFGNPLTGFTVPQ